MRARIVVFATLLLVLLSSLCMPPPARAAWSEQGTLIDAIAGGNAQLDNAELVRDAGGDFFVLTGGEFALIVQRVRGDGLALWPYYLTPPGPVGAVGDAPMDDVITPDGGGGLYFLCYESGAGTVAMHVSAAGAFDWGSSPPYGVLLSPAILGGHAAVGDSAGVWVAYPLPASGGSLGTTVALQHLVNAAPAPGWNPAGHALAAAGVTPALACDGTGGVYAFWTDASSARVTHVLADSTTAPDWSAGGTWLGAAAWNGFPNLTGSRPVLVPSGKYGWIATWTPDGNSGTVLLQRFRTDGSVDPAWPAGGRPVGPAWANGQEFTAYENGGRVVPDGLGGVHVTWRDSASQAPRWTHVLANGAFAPGHGAGGVSPLPAGAVFNVSDETAAAAGADGGLVFAWLDSRNPNHKSIHVYWWLANGTPDPSEPDTGRVVPIAYGDDPYALMTLESDHAGGGWVLWRTWDQHGPYNEFLWMNHMAKAGLALDVPATPLPRVLGLALAGANPVRGPLTLRCALPASWPATLALYDVAGRQVRRATVQGAGEQLVRFEHVEVLPAGVYVARLTQGATARVARVALLR